MKTIDDLMAEEDPRMTRPLRPPLQWWWLSFVDRIDHMVACQLGVAIVIGRDNVATAVQETWDYRCNPGGEVLGEPLGSDLRFPRRLTYRLLTDPGDIAEAQHHLAETIREAL